MQIRTNYILMFVLVLFAASVTLAQNQARESFGYAPTSLAGMGGADHGFSGPWVNDETGGIEGLVSIGNTRFAYDVMNWEIPHDTLHLQVLKQGAWSDHNRYKRPLAQAWPNEAGKSYWVSYLIDVKEALPVGNTYFFVKLFDGTTERLAIGKAGGRDANPPVWTCGSGWTGSGDDVSEVEIEAGPIWLVARIDMNGTEANHRTFMWVDPDPGIEPDTNTAAVRRFSTMPNGFDNVAVEFGGDGNNQRLVFDEIVVASSFGDLTAATPAASVAKESFSYAPTSLAGTGGASAGFSGPWVNDETGGIEGLTTIGNTRFAYDVMNWEIPHDTLHLQVTKNGAWSDHNRYKRPLAQAWPNEAGKSYWVSYLVDVKEPLPVGNTYFFVKLFDGTTERLAIGKAGGRDANPPVWTCGSGWTGSGDDVSEVEIEAGPIWLVVRIDMNGTEANHRTFMWVDPDPGIEPDTNTAAVKRFSTMPNGFDNVAVEFGGDGNDQRIIFDEIVLADNFMGLTTTGVRPISSGIPEKYNMSQNYPNPFNPVTNIRFSLPEAGLVTIKVYNLIGQEVASVMSEYRNAGTYDVDFNASNLTSGVYMYKISAGKYSEVKKMMLLK